MRERKGWSAGGKDGKKSESWVAVGEEPAGGAEGGGALGQKKRVRKSNEGFKRTYRLRAGSLLLQMGHAR
jgi:hypothetical protein